MIDGFRAAMDCIDAKPGFELVLFDEFDDLDEWELWDELQGDLEVEAKAYGMRTCERPQRFDTNPLLADMAFLCAAMRRRSMTSAACAIRNFNTVEIGPVSLRQPNIRSLVISKEVPDRVSQDIIATAVEHAQSQLGVHFASGPWVVAGRACNDLLQGLAAIEGVQTLVVPAHAGASTPVGLLVMNLIREHRVSFDYTTGLGVGDTPRLREAFRDLMDQASAEAFRLGFDTDDLVCEKYVEICAPSSSTFWKFECGDASSIEAIFERFDQLSTLTGGAALSNRFIAGASVRSTIETPKPRLPAVAKSSTIAGAGEPTQRIVSGPGRMLACLCEIDVPAGWRAEWEPSGDVVLTRI